MLEKDIKSYDDLELFKTQFYCDFDINLKRGKLFSNKNSFNLFFIMYKNAKSINKYWIKKYLFKRYIESNDISADKISALRNAIINYYTNEDDINKYIYWNEKFIYSDYNDEELNILYEMWLYLKSEDLEYNIFKDLDFFCMEDIFNIKSERKFIKIKRWKIFSNDIIYECFLYLYNNTKSFRKYKTRDKLFKEFLEKNTIWTKSAIKYIEILIDYIKDLDEIFSSSLYKLLDNFKDFNEECKKEYEEIDRNADMIYSEIELKFLSIFYNTDNINNYTYYENIEYMDSKYLEDNEENKHKNLSAWYTDYNNLFK